MTLDFGVGPIGILGAGGQARELTEYCGREVIFYSVTGEYLTPETAEHSLISIKDPPPGLEHTSVVIGVGAPGVKKLLLDLWPGSRFSTIQAKCAYVAKNVSIAEGSVVAPQAAVMAGTRIGAHVLLNTGSTVSHDCSIGDFSTVSPGVHIGGGCSIGHGAFIGIGATIRDGICIGDGAVIGAGAVVIADVLECEVVAGVPAKHLRTANGWMQEF